MSRSRLQSLSSNIDHMKCSLSSKNSPRNTVDFEAACSVYIRFRGVNGYPAGMDIAAGEYGYDLFYFRRMLEAGAVDVLQADVTRCGGITEFLRIGALCQARSLPLSAHCAPTLHIPVACALPNIRHLEYF